ncbi:hypothetical protein ACFW0H_29730 [Pseudomonas sp. CR3202]|uniref:hypothetical protein n=1 Tax=Pseudomonas sp. CR3202 TaxID=3351532 RepID=UPI003BF2D6DA
MSAERGPPEHGTGRLPGWLHGAKGGAISILIVAAMAIAGGCASQRAPEAPPIVVSQSTWREVDRDIVAASLAATNQARTYAQDSMEHWLDLVYQRTDSDFIPWFSSFWTRKWLSIKVAWYRMSSEGEREETVNRLTGYLQEAYDDHVLVPVSREIDPNAVMEQATRLYIQQLDQRLQLIPERLGVPGDQFDQHLKKIPAIELAPPPDHSASLYQVLHADPLEELPAFAALMGRFRQAPSGAGAWATDSGLSSITRQTSEQLESEMMTSGAVSIVSGLVGRVAGSVLSLGVTGFSALLTEAERPDREAHLRKSLNEAFDEEWLALMRNSDRGVMAGVLHLSGQVEGSLGQTETQPTQPIQPIQFDQQPRVVPVPWE